MLRAFLLFLIIVLALGFGVWAIATDAGPIGWFNALQQSLTGSYSVKLSVLLFLIVICGVVWGGGTLYLVIRPMLGSRVTERLEASVAGGVQAMARTNNRPVTPMHVALAWLMLLPVAWACSYGWYWFKQREHQQDLIAQYASVDLGSNDGSAGEGHDHLAVRGRYLFDQTLTFREGNQKRPKYSLVPIVGRTWQSGQPVTYVARVDDVQAFMYERKNDKDPFTFLAAPEGDVPSVAAVEFEKMGTPVGPSTRLLRVVPSREGRPVLDGSAEHDFQTFQIYGWICTGVIAFVMLAAGLIKVRLAWDAKRQARRAA
ncbi:hypothetical protein BH09PSE6_BH09PSE6_09720 [soil metagenome]